MNAISFFSQIYIQDPQVNERFKALRFVERLIQLGHKHYVVKVLDKKTVLTENTSSSFLQTVCKTVLFVLGFIPLMPLKLLYRWANKDFFHSLPRLAASNSSDGELPPSLSHLSPKPLERSPVQKGSEQSESPKIGEIRLSNETTPFCSDSPRPNERVSISLTPTQTGSLWLTEKIQDHIAQTQDHRSKDILCFAFVHTTCRERGNWDLSQLFSKRTVTRETLANASTTEIKNLSEEDFFSIIDLISGEHAMELLRDPTVSGGRKMGMYFFNTHLAATFAERQRTLSEATIEERTQQVAQNVFQQAKKYSSEQMAQVQTTAEFDHLDSERRGPSHTLQRHEWHARAWKQLNQEHLANGVACPITLAFLEKINKKLRVDFDSDLFCAPEARNRVQTPQGFRGARIEVSDPGRNLFYLPGHAVQQEMNHFVTWLNTEIEKCDQEKKNPIIVAALAYQKFVSIHPFSDGNGRTGRLLADCILRRYQLLPATWSEESCLVAIQPLHTEPVTPNQAVERMISALQRSYQVMATPV